MKLLLPVEVLDDQEGTLQVRLLTGFGEPVVRVDRALVEVKA